MVYKVARLNCPLAFLFLTLSKLHLNSSVVKSLTVKQFIALLFNFLALVNTFVSCLIPSSCLISIALSLAVRRIKASGLSPFHNARNSRALWYL